MKNHRIFSDFENVLDKILLKNYFHHWTCARRPSIVCLRTAHVSTNLRERIYNFLTDDDDRRFLL